MEPVKTDVCRLEQKYEHIVEHLVMHRKIRWRHLHLQLLWGQTVLNWMYN